jgi:polysaccharide biosynthesis protein PslH
MRILFVSTNLPVPPNNGQAIRSLSIVQALASSGHELTFVTFATSVRAESLYPLAAYCREIDLLGLEVANVSQGSAYLRRARCLLSLRSYSIERFRSRQMQARIQDHLRARPFDLIVCDSLYALVNVPQTATPIVLNCHNVEHLIFERYSRIERNFFKKFYATVERQLIRNAERQSCLRAAVAMVCSNVDRGTLHELQPNVPIFVVPNAVDTDSYRPGESDSSDPVLLFQGGMDWYPNRDAVEFFVRKILPIVREAVPSIKFIVAGRNPPVDFVGELGTKYGVEFTGTVPDIRPYLSAATVVVVPLRFGSGTRIKILEACAAGKPVVSTTVGAEGLGLESDKEIVVADDPADFARAVITLLGDPSRRNTIARSARTVVVDRYSLPTLKRKLDELLSSLE